MRLAGAGEVNCITLSPDNKFIASGSSDCSVRLWSVTNGDCKVISKGHSSEWNAPMNTHPEHNLSVLPIF